MSLAKKLKSARKDRGDILEKVAKAVGISTTYLNDLENGIVFRPKIEFISSLADYYGINKDELILASGKIPQDVYYKIIKYPELLEVIRGYNLWN
jgi:transcriptional regulator with XRE-family HTH domain